MERLFVCMPIFDNQWKRMGLTDDDLRELQSELSKNPQLGDVVRGAGGMRKARIPIENSGKSGGARVLYVDFAVREVIYLIYAYPKGKKENITNEERNAFKIVIEKLRKNEG